MTLATGLALGGQRPFVALYSTFLQRAFDQVVHDVCQNDAPVVIGVDRAGLVGEDGTSHQGMFTLPAQRQLPNLVIASPRDEQQLRRLLRTAFGQDHPFALHYPRDAGLRPAGRRPDAHPRRAGARCCARATDTAASSASGPSSCAGVEVAERLAAEGWSVGVVDARFAKPLDRDLILRAARGKRLVVTLEESAAAGGFGSAVLEALADARADGRSAAGGAGAAHRHPGGPVRGPRLGDGPATRPSAWTWTGIHAQVPEALARMGVATGADRGHAPSLPRTARALPGAAPANMAGCRRASVWTSCSPNGAWRRRAAAPRRC